MPLVFTPKNTKPARESRWKGFEKLEIASTTNRTANTVSTAPRDGFELREDICVATWFAPRMLLGPAAEDQQVSLRILELCRCVAHGWK
jgi:hypothetical protein